MNIPVDIACDGCQIVESMYPPDITKQLLKLGWTVDRDSHLCPECSKKSLRRL